MTTSLLAVGLCLGITGQTPLARVDTAVITTADVRLQLELSGIKGEASDKVRAATVKSLVERALIAQFLNQHKTEADPQQLAVAVSTAQKALTEAGIKEIDEKRLARHLALPLAWRKYVYRVVTSQQIQQYFKAHQNQLDGTRLRLSQIFLKYDQGEDENKAPRTTEHLKSIRQQILAKEISFPEAARQFSNSPSAKSGGDLGWVDPRGDLPQSVAGAAFALKDGELSKIVLSPFGAHLVSVTEVDPGHVSLEDARPRILTELSHQLWNKTVAAQKATAEIHILSEKRQ